MVVRCASFSSSAFSLVHQRLSFVLFYVLVVLVLIRESYFLSAWEFVWSCGKCGWCLLSCLRLGSSLLSPVRSPLPWSVWWFSCGSSVLLGKGLWSLCSTAWGIGVVDRQTCIFIGCSGWNLRFLWLLWGETMVSVVFARGSSFNLNNLGLLSFLDQSCV